MIPGSIESCSSLPPVVHRKERQVLIGITGRITPERKLRTQGFLKESAPLALQHMVIGPGTTGLCKIRDHLRYQEPVHVGNGHLHRASCRKMRSMMHPKDW